MAVEDLTEVVAIAAVAAEDHLAVAEEDN